MRTCPGILEAAKEVPGLDKLLRRPLQVLQLLRLIDVLNGHHIKALSNRLDFDLPPGPTAFDSEPSREWEKGHNKTGSKDG